MSCHRFGNDGGAVGPELTGAGSKYDARSLLESILEPSKVVSEQYQNVTAYLRNGESVTGRLVRANAEQVVIETDLLSGARETVPRPELEGLNPAALSPMPEGLVNTLSREEILDLVAYLQSGGRPDAAVFRR
ncbi:MAG: c-type cytochrome [Verrucomicrobiota bacterium]